MASETELPERLAWTLAWQTAKLMPELARPDAEERLRAYWSATRHMDEVLARIGLHSESLSMDVGGGLTTPLRWLPGRRVCVDPLAHHYASRFPLPLDQVTFVPGRGEALPAPSETVDLAICTNCIDHTDDPWAVMGELLRVLRTGGWLWFTCEARPLDKARNAGHPHALDHAGIHDLVTPFQIVQEWEEPWRGVYRYLTGQAPFDATELGFLLRKEQP